MKTKNAIFHPYLMLVYALIGMAIAVYDCYMIYTGQLLWCPPSIDGCNTVAYSPDGRIYGVPIGYFGVTFYLIMFALAALLAFGSSSRGIRLVVLFYTALGVCGSIGFMYLDLTLIHAFCIYCLISAILTVLLLLSAIAHFKVPAGGHERIANGERLN
jgi:uncharacterized membrane protein